MASFKRNPEREQRYNGMFLMVERVSVFDLQETKYAKSRYSLVNLAQSLLLLRGSSEQHPLLSAAGTGTNIDLFADCVEGGTSIAGFLSKKLTGLNFTMMLSHGITYDRTS